MSKAKHRNVRASSPARSDAPDTQIRSIAFYLPQFHPIEENDKWWGKGFTEWTNVTRAEPLFEGHYQPRRPADLGYYDLRVPEIMAQQAALAREAGIHGFCYYYYWFAGQRLLEKPVDRMLTSGSPDFPFCLCWANENWTRRWDGSEQEVLMHQVYGDDYARRIIRDMLPFLQDSRYITVDGKPLLLVYRIDIIPDCAAMTAIWREEAAAAGLPGLYLVRVESFIEMDPGQYGFDAVCEFPPHLTKSVPLAKPESTPGISKSFTGSVIDYANVAHHYANREVPSYKRFKAVVPAWDNTARKQLNAYILARSTPELYRAWLLQCMRETVKHHSGDERLVFINAWNEWAEGCYLEPDAQFGHQYLEATLSAHQQIAREHQSKTVQASDLEFAIALFTGAQYEEAYKAFAALHEKEPHNPLLLVYLGLIAVHAELHDDAHNFFNHAARISQDPANTFAAIGQRSLEAGFLDFAEHYFGAALQARPGFAGAAALLADTWAQQGRYADAIRLLDTIAARTPEQSVLARLVQLTREQGDPEQEVAACLRAARFPDSLARAITLLPAIPGGSPDRVLEAAQAFVRLTHAHTGSRIHAPSRERLRIGFVLGAQIEAGVAARLDPLLRHLNTKRFETYILSRSTSGTQSEQCLYLLADHWIQLGNLEGSACIDQLRAQHIDILVDLHGFHDLATLELVSQRLAPIQLSWTWPPQVLPLPTIDSIVLDAFSAQNASLVAALGRPASALSHVPALQFPPIRPALPRRDNLLRLACLVPIQQLARHGLKQLAVILQKLPDAQLLLNANDNNEHARTRVLDTLEQEGINRLRIHWVIGKDARAICHAWQNVDLCIVPPASDATFISLLAAWCGVPVIAPSMQTDGNTLTAQWLHALGASHLVMPAGSDEHSFAASVAALVEDRAALRANGLALRAALESANLMQAEAFTQDFGALLNELWRAAAHPAGAHA